MDADAGGSSAPSTRGALPPAPAWDSLPSEQRLERMEARMLMLAAAYRWHKAALHRLHPQQSNTGTGDEERKAGLGERLRRSSASAAEQDSNDDDDAAHSISSRAAVSGRGSPAATSSPVTADSPTSPTTRHGSPPSHSEASPGEIDASRVDQPAMGGYSWPARRKTPSPGQSAAKRGKLSDHHKPGNTVSPEGRAVRQQRRASSREKQRAKATSGAAAGQGGEESGALFHCPWPSCHKTFRRIKSRSAHLKWHGGGFNGDAKALQSASWPPRCDEVESGYPPATPALLTPTATAAATQRQLVSLDEPQAPPTPMPSVSVGDRVLLRQSSSEGIVTLQRVKVVEVVDPGRCNVILEDSGRLRADVQRQHVMHAIPLRHAELVRGLRVAAETKDSVSVLWPGTVHRIEPTRARVNFDSRPLCWLKAHKLYAIPSWMGV